MLGQNPLVWNIVLLGKKRNKVIAILPERVYAVVL